MSKSLTIFFIFLLFAVLVLGSYLAFVSGLVVVNAKAVPRVEVRADVVESDFVWNGEDGHYDLSMPSTCSKSDEELYQQIIRRFPKEEARLNSLTVNDVAFMMPDDDPEWHRVIFNHWKQYGTVNIVFYTAIVEGKQFYSFPDIENFIKVVRQ